MNYFRLLAIVLLWPVIVYPQFVEKQVTFSELTVNQGLSQNSVVSIAQDQKGFMWFATQDGLNKYDGKQFIHYPYQFEDITRNTYSKLGKIFVDNFNRVWIITNPGILHKQNQKTQAFERVSNINNVSTILQNLDNDYVLGTYGFGVYRIVEKTQDTFQILRKKDLHKNIYALYQLNDKVLAATSNGIFQINEGRNYQFVEIEKGVNFSSFSRSTKNKKLFVGSYGKGVFVTDDDKLEFKPFTGFKHDKLPNNLIVQDILVDVRGKLWVATYGKGVFLVDFENESIQQFMSNRKNPYALHYNDVLDLYEDFTGVIWLGTDGAGLSYYDKDLIKFNVLTNNQVPDDVSIDFVRAIAKSFDKIWLGTSNNGVTSIDFDADVYTMYTTQNSNLASNRIMSLYHDENALWIGHQNKGLQKLDSDKKFKTFESTKGMSIWKIYRAENHRVWLCTLYGLQLFDESEGIVKSYHSENSILPTNAIRTVEAGAQNQLWIGTESAGVFLLNTETETIYDVPEISEGIKSLYYDAGILWIGTNGNGLKSYNTKTKTIKHFTTANGLANNVIYGILKENENALWLSSNKGLTRIRIKEGEITEIENFSDYDGLQTNEFNTGAYFKDDNNILYFGGLEGLNWFIPSQLSYNSAKPKTVITNFEIFAESHSMVQDTVFSAKQNTMTFTFSGLHFSQPNRNQYKYQLVNHDPDWIYAGNRNSAHYTNLPPNDYTFKVISSNYDGIWNEKPAIYSFTIKKPWYLSNIALLCYALLALGIGVWIYRYLKWRWHVNMQLEFEHRETQRLKKLDEFKTKLYVNISHEFRTPLTLIIGLIERQISMSKLSKQEEKEVLMIQDNSKRLLNLVNQMLDLSKLETGHFKLSVRQGNLGVVLRQLAEAFKYKAFQKDIQLKYEIQQMDNAWFDRDIIEKIVSNLLSNAVKYTPKSGRILFETKQNKGQLVMSFINNGTTITNEQIGKLFQRYYRDQKSTDGVGIGLSLVKELAILSHGNIVANTIDEDEIQFTVTIPIERSFYNSSEIHDSEELSTFNEHSDFNHSKLIGKSSKLKNKPLLLIVEDVKVINDFVASIFEDEYQIKQTFNGSEGVEFALEFLPDVIITDVMMPKYNGIELCNQLKQDDKTAHIPIIMLTAKIGENNEIEGFKTGADAYITKPFSIEKLKLIVKKQLELREKLKQHYGETFSITPNIEINSADNQFLERLKVVLDKHLTNQNFNGALFCKEMKMSRTQLHRKLNARFGVSTTEFIRTQRLKLAQELLKTSDITIAEIAYQVGFNTPSYFNKCFKETFGCTPNEYALKQA